MLLYDSASRQKLELPAPPGPIRMYVCGPTVYQRIHIGNARPFVVSMWMRRWLAERRYEVKLVENITDINDKIYEAAARQRMGSAELAEQAAQWYIHDTDDLGLGRPDVEPLATETIPEIVALIEDLVARRLAGLRALPQDEVERVALGFVDLDSRTRAQVRELLSGQPAVLRKARDRIEDVAIGTDVGVTAVDQPPRHRHDLFQVRGRPRLVIRLAEAERLEVLVHRRDESRSQGLERLAALARALDDLVVDVGDVAHVGDAIARRQEPAPRDVEGELRAGVSDVDVVVHRDPADVHAHVPGLERREFLLAATQRVVDAQAHLRSHAAATPRRAGRARGPAAWRRAAPPAPARRACR